MLIYVTTLNEDRFVLYLKTSVCQVVYTGTELRFESNLDKLSTMKDFLINFGIRQVELREYGDGQRGGLIVKDELLMQLDDKDNIRGISVPVFTLL